MFSFYIEISFQLKRSYVQGFNNNFYSAFVIKKKKKMKIGFKRS